LKEELLHFIWKHQLFSHANLKCTRGKKLDIIHPGMANDDSGPDFFNARVRLADTLWAGNIEIHLKSSDWFDHKHHLDPAYKNVILHVVYDENTESEKLPLPTLSLRTLVSGKLLHSYEHIFENMSDIPCQYLIQKVDTFYIKHWLMRLAVERLEQRSNDIEHILHGNKNDWQECFYQFLGKFFGFRANNEAFLQLCQSITYKTLLKHQDSIFQLEALLYGQAGMLHARYKDAYFLDLKKEYLFLKKKYRLEAIPPVLWKFSRLRPANFPSIRISQFADLICKTQNLFNKTIECASVDALLDLYSCKASSYWDKHYVFDKITKDTGAKKPGKATIMSLIINNIIPFIFVYGKKKQVSELRDKALYFLENMEAENNKIIRQWEKTGIKAEHAAESQGLIQLRKKYCNEKKCLRCQIGTSILKQA
jgi:hypothetical protein